MKPLQNVTNTKRSRRENRANKKGSKLKAYSFQSEALRMKINNTTEVTDKAKRQSK